MDTTLGSATFGVGEFIASESAAVLSAVDWAYREAKDIGYALICAHRDAHILESRLTPARPTGGSKPPQTSKG